MTTEAVKKAPEVSRRDFLNWLTALSLGITGVFGLGTLAKEITPPDRSPDGLTKVGWLTVATVDSLVVGVPKLVEYGEEWVFLVKNADAKIIGLNAACPHVRCKLGWSADKKEFDCPCHTSSFSIDGKRLGGPAPRSMFAMKLKVEGGKVIIGGDEDAS
ncbi:MAG: Rieske (2Fe-2S) protein [Chloroflexi bacterium]|nr:Rieske (2Fe-2S) protein [Chloroflexota bacterium]